MSFARWSEDSDVYVFDDVRGGTTCCACNLADGDFNGTRAQMIDHLREHVAAGHAVPADIFTALAGTPRCGA